jgi:hypothetical protein
LKKELKIVSSQYIITQKAMMHLYEKTEKALGNLINGKNENSSKPQDRLKRMQLALPKLDAMHDALTISQIMPVAHEGNKLVSKLRLPYDL